ncbi:MAG: RagB/SusD family nutrient uptake outer membrane protein, partial [Bacteroidota bacterium]
DGIRDSYIFIDNIDRVPDISQAEKDRLKAEAKIIIATHYVEMFQHYGGIIWLNHAYAPDEDMTKERLTISQTVDTLTSLIDEAIPFLPFELENPETWSGRITSAAAMGLKVKFLSFAAAPLFNNDQPFLAGEAATKELVWTGGYQPYLWEMLRDAAKELIDKIEASSYYRMTNTGNPQDDYKRSYFNRTPETLYSTRGPYKWNWGELPDIIRNNHWMATTAPLHNYAMKFPMKNGMSIEDPASGYDPKNPYYNRDPRLYESLVVNGGYWQGRKAELYNGGRERKNKRIKFSFAGYQLRKWRLDMQEVYGETPQWPYVRIPEIYLAYAEALNELNNGPTADAFKYVNKIRERVDVGPIEDFIGKPQNAITKQEFLDALLNERAIELGCENVRWFDMSRYKLKDVFTSKDLAMDITLKVNQSSFDFSNVDFNEHDQYFEYVITELPNEFYWQEPSQFDPKYYLEPIPFSEIQKDYGLIQNPGWEL